MDRRRFLRAAAAGGSVALAGCALGGDPGNRTADRAGRSPSTTPPPEAPGAGRDDFLWLQQGLWTEARVRENLVAQARRQDLSVVLSKNGELESDVGRAVEELLSPIDERGVRAWLATGTLQRLTAREFVEEEPPERDVHLERLGALARAYAERFPEGRLVLWEEAPIAGRWNESGEWNDRAVANLQEYGPAVFAAQRGAIRDAAPDVDVGVFLHFPYLVDSKRPEVFAAVIDGLRERDAMPDFTFADFYRGWYEQSVNPTVADRAVRSLVANAREHTDDRPVYFMGGDHTTNPKHTPSKQSMLMDLRASLEAGVAGRGWYARPVYVRTERGFDPYVPNVAPEEAFADGQPLGTLTAARDRFQYAYAATLAARPGVDRARRFDLWLEGEDLDFYEHRLSVRGPDGWRYVGDFAGYADGDHPYTADGRRHVAIFHGFGREVLRDGGLDLRVEPREGDGARLDTVYAVPFDVATYRSEREATELLGERDGFDRYCLGSAEVDAALDAGTTREVRLEVGTPDDARPLSALLYPDHGDVLEALGALEARSGFDRRDRIDLWATGRGFEGLDDPEGAFLAGEGEPTPVAEASAAASVSARAAAFYGVPREPLVGAMEEDSLAVRLRGAEAAGASLDTLYAMPYFGRVNFTPPGRIAAVVAADEAEARRYSLATWTG